MLPSRNVVGRGRAPMDQPSNSAADSPPYPLPLLMAAAIAGGLLWLYAVLGHLWLP
jgi:hypothetical protein